MTKSLTLVLFLAAALAVVPGFALGGAVARPDAQSPAVTQSPRSAPSSIEIATIKRPRLRETAPAEPPKPVEIPPGLTPVEPVPTPLAPESVEADVSMRSIAVTSGYAGAEIVVFGTIENSRQPSAESGFYDVAIVVEGVTERQDLRQKQRVGGLWVNRQAFAFASVPSYYALASTRPVEEFTEAGVRDALGLGFDHIAMTPAVAKSAQPSSVELAEFRQAIARLKSNQSLYLRDDYGVVFSGRSLFRAAVRLPATIPVGMLTARVYLFQNGIQLSQYQSRVTLTREGLERWLHDFAFDKPLLYGLFVVALAVAAGLTASAVFRPRAM